MTLSDNDLFLVNTSDETKTVKKSELMTKPSDNDYMLVNKASDNSTYKIKFSEVKTELNPTEAPILGDVVLTEDSPGGDRFTGQSFTTDITVVNAGTPTATRAIKAKLVAEITKNTESSDIQSVGPLTDYSWDSFQPGYVGSMGKWTTGNKYFMALGQAGDLVDIQVAMKVEPSSYLTGYVLQTTYNPSDPSGSYRDKEVYYNQNYKEHQNWQYGYWCGKRSGAGTFAIFGPLGGANGWEWAINTNGPQNSWTGGVFTSWYDNNRKNRTYKWMQTVPSDNPTWETAFLDATGYIFGWDNDTTTPRETDSPLATSGSFAGITKGSKWVVFGNRDQRTAQNENGDLSLRIWTNSGSPVDDAWTLDYMPYGRNSVEGSDLFLYSPDACAYGAGKYVLVGPESQDVDQYKGLWGIYSYDLKTWYPCKSISETGEYIGGISSLKYDGGLFVGTDLRRKQPYYTTPPDGWNVNAMVSEDGITWTLINFPRLDDGYDIYWLYMGYISPEQAAASTQSPPLEEGHYFGRKYQTFVVARYGYGATGFDGGRVLTLVDSNGLENYFGGKVTQSDGNASGNVIGFDSANSKLTVVDVEGTFTPGEHLIGSLAPGVTSNVTGVGLADDNWTSVSLGAELDSCEWRRIRYANGQWIAVADGGPKRIMYSSDGINWTASNYLTNNLMKDCCYSIKDDLWVAGGTDSTPPHRSYDAGKTWEPAIAASNSTDQIQYADCWGLGANFENISLCGSSRNWYSSQNWYVWTPQTNSSYQYKASMSQIAGVCSGDRGFIVLGNSSGIISYGGPTSYSTESGAAIEKAGILKTSGWADICFGNGVYVCVNENNYQYNCVMYSTGQNFSDNRGGEYAPWKGSVSNVPGNDAVGQQTGWSTIAHCPLGFVALSTGVLPGVIGMYSTDGAQKWAEAHGDGTGSGQKWRGLAYGQGKFVALAGDGTNRLMWSKTGGIPTVELTFADDTGLAQLKPGDQVVQGETTGIIAGVDVANKSIHFSSTIGTFVTGQPVVCQAASSVESTSVYGSLDNNLEVVDIQVTDPGYTQFQGTSAQIKFPKYFPDAQTPDATLLPGSSLQAEVLLSNVSYTDSKDSGVITPGDDVRAAPKDMNNPADVALFNQIKESFDTYEGERDARRAGIAQAMRNANFSQEQIESVGLE